MDSWSGSLNVARDPDGLYAWLEVMPDRVDPGDGVVVFITIENTKDYAQTWPVELVDNTGNVWWPKLDDYVLDTNYTLSKGAITIRPHKTAHIMVTDIEVYQNTTFYFKVGGITMAIAYVEVEPTNRTELKQVSFECNNPEFNWNGLEYKATLVCKAVLYNPSSETIVLNSVTVKNWSADNLEFMKSFPSKNNSWWSVDYPNSIKGFQTATLTFRYTAHTGLGTLETKLFGTYVLVSLTYVISPQNGEDFTFIGADIIHIKQDNQDVIVDIGTNVLLTGADIKAGITILKLARTGEVVGAFKNAWPYIVSFFKWAWPKLHHD